MKLPKIVFVALMTLCLGASVAACGKKVAPTPPEDSRYPRQYPKPQ